jgi:type II secretory pathway component PulM
MRAWYSKLAEREKRFVAFGASAVILAGVLGLTLSLSSSLAQTRQRVATKQDDLAFIQAAVSQLGGPGAPAGATVQGDSLVVFIDSSARESGLAKSLVSSDPTGDRKGLRIRLDRVPFDGLIAWLARLAQNHGVSVESADIESAGETGLVNAGLVLRGG